MAERQLKLTLVGDSKQLERTLSRTENRLQKFGRTTATVGRSGGGIGALGASLGALRAGPAIAGFAALAVGITSTVRAAESYQVVNARAAVAVKDAGLSFQFYRGQIEETIAKQSRLTGLTRADLTDAFSNLVRTTKDVGAALNLLGVTSDLARTKGLSLADSSSLVARVYNGNYRGLNRLGIAIHKVTIAQDALRGSNARATFFQIRAAKAADDAATKQRAVAILQATLAGQAEAYGKTAAGAQDRLRVSLEGVKETIGSGLLPVVESWATTLAGTTNAAAGLVKSMKELMSIPAPSWLGGKTTDHVGSEIRKALLFYPFVNEHFFSGGKKGTPDVTGGAAAFQSQFGLGALKASGPGAQKTISVGKAGGEVTAFSEGMVSKEYDARLSGSQSLLKGVLAKEKKWLLAQILNTLPGKAQNQLKQALLGVTDEVASINQAAIDAANQSAQDAKYAKEQAKSKAEAARAKHKAAMQKALDATTSFLDKLKQGTLDAIGRKEDKVNVARQLSDAKEKLRLAKQLGGAEGIKEAQRGIQDANFARQRQQVESARFTSEGKGRAGVTISGGIHLHGIQNVAQLKAELVRLGKTTTGQSRGRQPGYRPY